MEREEQENEAVRKPGFSCVRWRWRVKAERYSGCRRVKRGDWGAGEVEVRQEGEHYK